MPPEPSASLTGSSPQRSKAQPRATLATRVFEPENAAAAFRLSALMRALRTAGYDTTVFTSQPRRRVKSTKRVRRWPVLRDRSGTVRGYLQYASFDVPLFFRLLLGPRSEVVIAEPPPTTGVIVRIVCLLRRTPYVYFSADVSSTAAAGIGVSRTIVSILRKVESWVLRGASAVLAVSDGVRDEVISLGVQPEHVTVVGTGIDTDRFFADGPTVDADYPYLVYAGTMSEVHGAGIFIEAFGRIAGSHPTARLKFFGQGVDLREMQEAALSLGTDRIDFADPIDGEQLAAWLRGARAGLASVRPDRGYDFAFATKALTSLGCGSPVVYAGVGPMHDLIDENRLGWAVDWDVQRVAAAMDLALSTPPSPDLRKKASDWVRASWSLGSVADRAVAAISRLLG